MLRRTITAVLWFIVVFYATTAATCWFDWPYSMKNAGVLECNQAEDCD